MPLRSRGRVSGVAHVEPLEGRVLLASSLGGLVNVRWDGHEAMAPPGQWIMRLDMPGASSLAESKAMARVQGLVRSARADVQVNDYRPDMGLALVTAPATASYEQLRNAFARLPGFKYIEPNVDDGGAASVPDDPLLASQWAFINTGQTTVHQPVPGLIGEDIKIPQAWDITTGDDSVVIGMLDSGVNYNHPDLAPNIWHNPGEIPGNGIDDDHDGYVDDVYGWAFNSNSSDVSDHLGHGTEVAGVVAAVGNNGTGVAGVDWGAKLMALKVFDAYNTTTQYNQIQAFDYAIMMRNRGVNIRIINRSIRHDATYTQGFKDAVTALNNAGILLVSAAGNDHVNNDSPPLYPGAFALPNVLSVTATNNLGQLAGFSNWGASTVQLAAPGVDILSTGSLGDYAPVSGTSMSAPMVAGVAALCWTLRPNATIPQVVDAILGGVDPLPSLAGITVTGGRLNAYNTLLRFTAGRSPFLGSPVELPSTIEVENFDKGGEGVAYHENSMGNLGRAYRPRDAVDLEPTTDAGGGFDVGWTSAGEWMEYSVDVAAGGTFSLDARVASPAAGGKFHVEVDGTNVTGSMGVPNTGGWQKWQTISRSGIALAAGPHIMRLAMDANNASGYVGNFNWLRIGTPAPVVEKPYPDPAVPAGVPGTIQVENYDSGGEGLAYHDATAGNSGGAYRAEDVDIETTTDAGGGYDVGWATAGEWLQYTINVPAGGAYNLEARVASLTAGGKFHVEVDGANLTGAMTVPATGGWQKWQSVTKTNLALPAGQHILRLAMDGNSPSGFVGNFNWLRLTPYAPAVQAPYPDPSTPAAVPGVISLVNYDTGGEGVAYHDVTTGNAGGAYRPAENVDIEASGSTYNVGWALPGEWLNYTINVAADGKYDAAVAVACPANGASFHLELDGANLTGPMAVPNTGGWQVYQNVTKRGLHLGAGQHVMRLVFDTPTSNGYAGNFRTVTFT